MKKLKIGVLGTSLKENEYRLPIHPLHLDGIDGQVKKNLYFENSYASKFNINSENFLGIGGLLEREAVLGECDVVLMPKPVLSDIRVMKEGGVVCGWAHLVQQKDITQTCIDRKLSVLAWESMHQWGTDGDFKNHTFYKNNEIAGYAAVLDSLRLIGVDGNYGPDREVVVIGFGSVGRGATRALLGLGFKKISVYTDQDPKTIKERPQGVQFYQVTKGSKEKVHILQKERTPQPFIEKLSSSDIIVNAIIQDTDAPVMFVDEDEVSRLKTNALIVDVSCDEGMGFYGAKPTSFEEPIFKIKQIH